MDPKLVEPITMLIPSVSSVELGLVALDLRHLAGKFAIKLLHGSALWTATKEKF